MFRQLLGHIRKILWLIVETPAYRIEQRRLILVIGSLNEHVSDIVVLDMNVLGHDKHHEILPP